jgi:hypothetical protein
MRSQWRIASNSSKRMITHRQFRRRVFFKEWLRSRSTERCTVAIRKPLAIEKAHIDRIIDEDLSLTRLVYSYTASAAIWLDFGTLF